MASRKQGQTKAAAEVEAVMSNADILYQILLRLPVKSLVKLKRVSRQWYHLISLPKFGLDHNRRNPYPGPDGLFVSNLNQRGMRYVGYDKDYTVKNFSKGPCEFPREICVTDSCNGLLLCLNQEDEFDPETKFYVCNPTTKQVARIPNPDNRKRISSTAISLAFDPSTLEKFRLVCLLGRDESPPSPITYRIHVYESETGSWRRSAPAPAIEMVLYPGVYWKGAVHWLGRGWEDLYCFDLRNDCFRKTATLPRGSKKYFGACQGHLYVVATELDFSCGVNVTRWVVYEMEHDFSCLSAKISIRDDQLGHTRVPRIGGHVLVIFQEEEQLLVLVTYGDQVFTYNFKAPNSTPKKATLSSRLEGRLLLGHHIVCLAPV